MDGEVEVLGFVGAAHRRNQAAEGSRPAKRKAGFVRPEDIIELTDSDDDEPAPPPQAGPSRARNPDYHPPPPPLRVPLFLPEILDDEAPMPRVAQVHGNTDNVAATSGRGPLQDAECDQLVANVLEIIPDVDPTHVALLIRGHFDTHSNNVLEPVLHNLFENPDYPKIVKDKGKGKRKRDEEDEQSLEMGSARTKAKIDYGSKDRPLAGGPYYRDLALVSRALSCHSSL